MKCLHILPMNKLSGAEKMALLICRSMKKYVPIVVCGGENLKSTFEKEGIKSYSLSFANKDKISTLIGLKNIIKENDVKILHAHDNNASLNAYLVKKLYRLDVKVVSHIHSCYPFLRENGINKKIDSFLRPRYDFNIVCGNLVNDFYISNTTYYRKSNYKILSNAIEIGEINNVNEDKVSKLRNKYNIPKDKIILGFVGRICEIKGIIPFIREFAKRKDEFKNHKVLLVGSGEQEVEVKNLILELNLDDLFILTGFQSNVYDFYPLIDIFFLPSHYEGLPMVLLEAMAFKKVVVSMNVGGIKEIIKDNETGFLVEKDNYSKLIDTLLRVSNININGVKEQAFNYIQSNFNIENYEKMLNKVYETLIS